MKGAVGDLHPDPRQGGQGAAACGRRPGRRAEGLHEGIALGAELHRLPLLLIFRSQKRKCWE
jgi:hypothetical protein